MARMLRYSLLTLLLANCAVYGLTNDGDAAKSARLVSVVKDEPLPLPVVGLPGDAAKAANITQSPESTELANSTLPNATQNANSSKSGDDGQSVNTTAAGDAKVKSSVDPKAKKEISAVEHQEADASKSSAAVESSEKEQADIKMPAPATHLDNKDPPAPNNDGQKPQETSKNNETEVSTTTKAPQNTEKNPEVEEGSKSTSTVEETITTTVPAQQTTIATEATEASSASSTSAKTSTTDESVSTSSGTSSATEATTLEASAAAVESTPEDEGMPSGIVALIMAIVFAVVVVIVYVGLLLWRRYLEYRYGTRELLVNDLEFDTNDLRHFEL